MFGVTKAGTGSGCKKSRPNTKPFCDNEFVCKKIEKNIIFRVRVYTFPFKVELGHETFKVMKKSSNKNNIISLILLSLQNVINIIRNFSR